MVSKTSNGEVVEYINGLCSSNIVSEDADNEESCRGNFYLNCLNKRIDMYSENYDNSHPMNYTSSQLEDNSCLYSSPSNGTNSIYLAMKSHGFNENNQETFSNFLVELKPNGTVAYPNGESMVIYLRDDGEYYTCYLLDKWIKDGNVYVLTNDHLINNVTYNREERIRRGVLKETQKPGFVKGTRKLTNASMSCMIQSSTIQKTSTSFIKSLYPEINNITSQQAKMDIVGTSIANVVNGNSIVATRCSRTVFERRLTETSLAAEIGNGTNTCQTPQASNVQLGEQVTAKLNAFDGSGLITDYTVDNNGNVSKTSDINIESEFPIDPNEIIASRPFNTEPSCLTPDAMLDTMQNIQDTESPKVEVTVIPNQFEAANDMAASLKFLETNFTSNPSEDNRDICTFTNTLEGTTYDLSLDDITPLSITKALKQRCKAKK